MDFGNRQLVIHSGKGNKDRLTVLPQSLVQPLQSFLHMRLVRHQLDMFEGIGLAPLQSPVDRLSALLEGLNLHDSASRPSVRT